MRPIRVDIAGTTDGKGNFSQAIRLDKTGEWRNLKVAIGTTGPAEWTLSTANTPLTYGRGRRVTLGPELLQPFDALTVACTGGPLNALVTGSASGTAGPEADILATYTPAPNTIALDTAADVQPLVTLTAGQGATSKVLPVRTMSVVWAVTNSGGVNTGTVEIVGDQSGIVYEFASIHGAGGTSGSVPSSGAALVNPVDTSLTVTVTAGIGNPQVAVWTLAAPAAVYVTPTPEAVFSTAATATPAAWQAPNLAPIRIATTFPTTQATATELIAGLGTQSIRVFQLSGAWDASAAASSLHLVDAPHGSPGLGVIRGDLSQAVQTPPPLGPLGPLTAGNSLYAFADSGTPVLRGTLSASQG